MTAAVIDLADVRRLRGLPVSRPVELLPPRGKRPGDPVRHVFTDERGTVMSARLERVLDHDNRPKPVWLLAVLFPSASRVLPADDVVPLSLSGPDEAPPAPPADVEA